MNDSTSRPPVIRQVAVVMLALCLLVPCVLYLAAQRGTERAYEPARTRAATEALLSAIAPAANPPAPLPDAAALARLLPQCARAGSYQGLPFMEDLAEQVQMLDRNLAALTGASGRRNAPLRARYQLQPAAWAQALRDRQVGCQQAAQALRLLASDRGESLLAQAQWREFRPAARQPAGGPAVQLSASSLVQTDPWRGWPGCIWLGGLEKGSTALHVPDAAGAAWQRELCTAPDLRPPNAREVVTASAGEPGSRGRADDPAWSVPNDLGVLLQELSALRLPEGRLYQDYAQRLPAQANRRSVGRSEVEMGFNVQLTIDPRTQAIAQRMAECYTGRPEACAQAGLALEQVGTAEGAGAPAMWERAATRMTAVAVIDVATGRIDALASAHTPCFRQENDGPFRDAACLPLWTEPRRRPDALLNHAVFADYLPGSTIKPILASVFFEDAAPPAETLTQWLAASDTNRFNDTLFCLNSGSAALCDRPARAQQRAADLGWNVDCSAQPSPRCGRADLLFGRRLGARLDDPALDGSALAGAAPLQAPALAGRLFVSPTAGGGPRLMPLASIRRNDMASCRDAAGRWQAANCTAAFAKPLVNEAAGQGQARTTAVGLASMLARLAAAANGLREVRRPHLVERITDARGQPVETAATRSEGDGTPALASPEATVVDAKVAQSVLRGLVRASGTGGTAHLICRHVFGPRCADAGARIAGKTGTPSFSLDRVTFSQARQRCRAQPQNEDCFERPMKLYVAAINPGGEAPGRYTKVIAVMSERNWTLPAKTLPAAQRERVHGGTNDANNVAVEIAMRIANEAWLSSLPPGRTEGKPAPRR